MSGLLLSFGFVAVSACVLWAVKKSTRRSSINSTSPAPRPDRDTQLEPFSSTPLIFNDQLFSGPTHSHSSSSADAGESCDAGHVNESSANNSDCSDSSSADGGGGDSD